MAWIFEGRTGNWGRLTVVERRIRKRMLSKARRRGGKAEILAQFVREMLDDAAETLEERRAEIYRLDREYYGWDEYGWDWLSPEEVYYGRGERGEVEFFSMGWSEAA